MILNWNGWKDTIECRVLGIMSTIEKIKEYDKGEIKG